MPHLLALVLVAVAHSALGATQTEMMKVRMSTSAADVRVMESRLAHVAESAKAWAKGMEDVLLAPGRERQDKDDLALHHARRQASLIADAFSKESLRELADSHIASFIETGEDDPATHGLPALEALNHASYAYGQEATEASKMHDQLLVHHAEAVARGGHPIDAAGKSVSLLEVMDTLHRDGAHAAAGMYAGGIWEKLKVSFAAGQCTRGLFVAGRGARGVGARCTSRWPPRRVSEARGTYSRRARGMGRMRFRGDAELGRLGDSEPLPPARPRARHQSRVDSLPVNNKMPVFILISGVTTVHP